MILLLFFASSQQVSVSPDESEQLCDDFLRLSNLTLARSQALFAGERFACCKISFLECVSFIDVGCCCMNALLLSFLK
jgi:hypothetical protein